MKKKVTQKLQSSIREKIQLINSLSYDVAETEVLQTASSILDGVVQSLKEASKKVDGLPIHGGETVQVKKQALCTTRRLPLRRNSRLKRKKGKYKTGNYHYIIGLNF